MSTDGRYVPPGGPRIERARAVTDGGGNATVTWSPAFTAPPVVQATVEAGSGFRTLRIAQNTAAGTSVHVDESAGVTLLGIGVLAVGAPSAGVTVHVTATEPS